MARQETFSVQNTGISLAPSAQSDGFQVVIDALPTGLIVISRAGLICRSNAEAERLFGYSSGELEGKPVEMLVPLKHRADHSKLRTSFFNTPTNRRMGAGRDLNGSRKDGSEFPIEIGLQPFANDGDLMVFAVIVDISERKRIETALHEANLKLQIKNREMESFIYSISHDLKSPMVTAGSYLQFIHEDLQAGNLADVMDSLERVERANQRMRQLVNDLLNLSRVGRLELRISDFSFASLAQEVVKDLDARVQEAKVEVHVSVPPGAKMRADQSRIRQILENLIGNAVKYGSTGENPTIEILLESTTHYSTIVVRDNGKGINPDFHQKIFGLFERLESDKEGTGIGLAIVARIAEEHGGKAWVESEVGKGSSFHVQIKSNVRATETPQEPLA